MNLSPLKLRPVFERFLTIACPQVPTHRGLRTSMPAHIHLNSQQQALKPSYRKMAPSESMLRMSSMGRVLRGSMILLSLFYLTVMVQQMSSTADISSWNMDLAYALVTSTSSNDNNGDNRRSQMRNIHNEVRKNNASTQLLPESSTLQYYTPRVLIGILSDSQTETASEMRQRQREVFQYWKDDTRICSMQQFLSNQEVLGKDNIYMTRDQIGQNQQNDCQVVYVFVLGAYSNSTSPHFIQTVEGVSTERLIPTVRLYDTPDQPLTLDHIPVSNQDNPIDAGASSPPYQDVVDNNDGIFLNIIENLNLGKTPTFLYWANKLSMQWKIPYIVKCDTDVFIRMDRMIEMLQQDLPPIPVITEKNTNIKQPSVMAGELFLKPRGKWLQSLDESFYKSQYFMGQKYFFFGGFYLMSQDLVEVATKEARLYHNVIPTLINGKDPRKGPHGYIGGIEDHDSTVMAEHGHYHSLLSTRNNESNSPSVIQWLIMPADLLASVHQIKKSQHWNKVLKREIGELQQRLDVEAYSDNSHALKPVAAADSRQASEKVTTMILVYGANSPESRQYYRQHLSAQTKSRCSLVSHIRNGNGDACDVRYIFVVGTGQHSSKIVHNQTTLETSFNIASAALSREEEDVLIVAADGNDELTLGLGALSFIQDQSQNNQDGVYFDAVIFCRSSYSVNITDWTKTILSTAQYSLKSNNDRHLIVGDVRERNKEKHRGEFMRETNEKYSRFFDEQYIGTHLYLGSDCFALSTSLIPILLKSVHDPKVELLLQGTGHLGHDLTYLAYAAGQIKLHWMRVPNSLQFWAPNNSHGWTDNIYKKAAERQSSSQTSSGQARADATEGRNEKQQEQKFLIPRVLIGIVSDSQTEKASENRQRQRQVLQLWERDHRICSMQQFLSKQESLEDYNSYMTWDQVGQSQQFDCQVVYVFVLGAYSTSGSIPNSVSQLEGNLSTLKLDDTLDHPLVLDHDVIDAYQVSPPYQDILDNNDGIFLNIVENMNHGKTPTFFFWASIFSKQWNIPYVAKCDTDTFLYPDKIIDVLQQSLPPFPVVEDIASNTVKQPAVLAGALCYKLRKYLVNVQNTLWSQQYFMGLQHYLQGGYYLMSRNLAEEATEEARKYMDILPALVNYETIKEKMNGISPNPENHGYLEGHEDHDEIAMVENHHYQSLLSSNTSNSPTASVIQWLVMPRQLMGFYHSREMKLAQKWTERLKAETARLQDRTVAYATASITNSVTNEKHGASKVKTLVLVYGCTGTPETCKTHRQQSRDVQVIGSNCRTVYSDLQTDNNSCDMHYLFVTAANSKMSLHQDFSSTPHNQTTLSRLLNSSVVTVSSEEEDVLVVNGVADTDHLALALSALSFVQDKYQLGKGTKFDAVIFCHSSHTVNVDSWGSGILSTAKYSLKAQQHVVVGDIRERGYSKRNKEIRKERNNANYTHFFWSRHHSNHLYVGSDCFAISTSLIPAVLSSVYHSEVGLFMKGTGFLGHDLTYLVYAADDINVNWMRVPKAMRFWSPLEERTMSAVGDS